MSESDYAASIQTLIDATAQARGYASGVALASYAGSTVGSWASEATAFIAWRDAVWAYAYQQLASVQQGERVPPTMEEFIIELPQMTWPA